MDLKNIKKHVLIWIPSKVEFSKQCSADGHLSIDQLVFQCVNQVI